MAIEPIGSIMTYQAQSVPQTKQVQPQSQGNMDVSGQEVSSTAFDATTMKIAEVEQKGSQAKDQGSNGKEQNLNNEQLKKAVEKFNKTIENSEAIFGIHEGTNRVTIKIINKDTKEVIKELPPEKTLDMIAKVWEMAGILVDEKR